MNATTPAADSVKAADDALDTAAAVSAQSGAASTAAAEAAGAGAPATGASVSPAASKSEINLDVVLDIPVTLSMEVGRSRLSIRHLMQLNQGSVVELERATGEPLDVFVNGTLVAHGEVVVINEKFGIRLTDVISPAERIRKLR
jgi:flagellar motor switch protein FliN/FliY